VVKYTGRGPKRISRAAARRRNGNQATQDVVFRCAAAPLREKT